MSKKKDLTVDLSLPHSVTHSPQDSKEVEVTLMRDGRGPVQQNQHHRHVEYRSCKVNTAVKFWKLGRKKNETALFKPQIKLLRKNTIGLLGITEEI